MADKVILHCDLNNFFASVELLDKPELRDKPCAVGGSAEKRHGIILAKNECAKKFGVVTAQPIWQAQRKCPELVVLEPHYDKYSKYSKLSREILLDYTDLVEPFSIDESWLDVTGSQKLFGSGEEIAHKIRTRHKKELNLTVSVGVSFNKTFAKLGSDMNKPDAVTIIDRQSYKSVVWKLPVRDLMGIGRSTQNKLESVGIYTLGDLANTDVRVLKHMLGIVGEKLWICANGADSSPVVSGALMPVQKSVSRSVTPESDILDINAAKEFFYFLAKDVYHEMLEMDVYAYSVSIELRDTKLNRQTHTRTLAYPLKTSQEIVKEAMSLINESYDWKLPLRSIGVGVGDFKQKDMPSQTSVFLDTSKQNKREVLEQRIDDICRKYGQGAIGRAVLLGKDVPESISTFSAKNKALKNRE